jgi:hypothetical protein
MQAGLRGAEPNLITRGGPCQTPEAAARQGRQHARLRRFEDADTDRVALGVALVKGDALAVGRETQEVDHVGGFINRMADGRFQTVHAVHAMDDDEVLTVRRPVRVLYVFEHFPRRTAGQRYASQRANPDERGHRMAAGQNGQFTAGGHRQDHRVLQAQGT